MATTESKVPKTFDLLVAAQADMENPPLDSVNPHFKNKYASLPKIIDIVRKALNKHGLFLSQHIERVDVGGHPSSVLVTSVAHGDEVVVLDERPIVFTGNSQKDGAAETYAKRYALCSVFGLAGDEDDDGESTNTKQALCPQCGRAYTIKAMDKPEQFQCSDCHVALK